MDRLFTMWEKERIRREENFHEKKDTDVRSCVSYRLCSVYSMCVSLVKDEVLTWILILASLFRNQMRVRRKRHSSLEMTQWRSNERFVPRICTFLLRGIRSTSCEKLLRIAMVKTVLECRSICFRVISHLFPTQPPLLFSSKISSGFFFISMLYYCMVTMATDKKAWQLALRSERSSVKVFCCLSVPIHMFHYV